MVLNSHTRNHSLQNFKFIKLLFEKFWANLSNFPPKAAKKQNTGGGKSTHRRLKAKKGLARMRQPFRMITTCVVRIYLTKIF